MATTAGGWRALRGADRAERVRPTPRDDLVTILLGLWMTAGISVDGWVHNSRTLVESFFTPWHAVLYSGYATTALWMCWLVVRGGRAGRVGLAAIPRGYGLGLAGAVIFGLGGLCDMLWHLIFGVEQGLDALLSPSHLALVAGATLILSSPFRSAWASTDPAGDAPRLRAFLPPLLSLAAAVDVASFINAYLWAFLDGYHTRGLTNFYAGRADARRLLNLSRELGLAEILLTNALLLAPALLGRVLSCGRVGGRA